MKNFSFLFDFLCVDLVVSKRLFDGVIRGVRVGVLYCEGNATNSPSPLFGSSCTCILLFLWPIQSKKYMSSYFSLSFLKVQF